MFAADVSLSWPWRDPRLSCKNTVRRARVSPCRRAWRSRGRRDPVVGHTRRSNDATADAVAPITARTCRARDRWHCRPVAARAPHRVRASTKGVRLHRVRLQRAHLIAFVQARTSLTRDVYPLRCVHDPPVSRAFYENIGEISCDEPVGTGSANAADIQTLMRQSGTDADSGRRTSTAASSSSRYVPTGLTRWPFAERRTQSCETCPTQ